VAELIDPESAARLTDASRANLFSGRRIMRLSIFTIAGLALVVVASLGTANEPDKAPVPAGQTETIEIKVTPIPARDDELRKLLKSRYEAASAEMEATTALYSGGRVSLQDTCDAIRRFSTASVEMAETPIERAKQCQRAFESAKAVEDLTKRKFEQGVEPVQASALATFTRLDMEIKLHLACKEAGIGKDEAKKLLPPNPPAKAGS
jgi:hypothetical protein